MSTEKKLFILDSYALIFRSYYAFIKNPMRNSKGMNTSTVFGFTLALDEILRKESPTHMLAAFDATGPTFRHKMYKEYKANRDATPEDIKNAVPYIKQLLDGYRIPIVEKLGYEADDIIGTIAKNAEIEGFKVYMVTPDKDFAQLVSDKIIMYKPGRSGNSAEKWGVEQVLDKFSIKDPSQVIDILGLWGDSSDNIPGAPGIGEKTAIKLIAQYGSVESLYEHINEIKGKQKEKLEEAKDIVLLSKKLATILLDAEIEFDLIKAAVDPPEKEVLNELFDELDFKNLKSRILGEEYSASPTLTDSQGSLFNTQVKGKIDDNLSHQSIQDVPHDYSLVLPGKKLDELISTLKEQSTICFDTETTGLDIIDSKLVGISFCWKAHSAVYVNLNNEVLQEDKYLNQIREVFENEKVTFVGQNLKYDMHILKNHGIEVTGKLFDTMVAHHLIHPDKKHSLDAMAEEYLGYSKIKTEELIGAKNTKQLQFNQLEANEIKDYACEDADITFQLSVKMQENIKEANIEKLFNTIEMPLVRVLTDMEHHGVYLNTDVLEDVKKGLIKSIKKTEDKIYDLAGTTFNVGSPKQLGIVLFEKLKIDPNAKKTKSNQYSTSEDVLIKLKDKHEIIEEILSFRSAKKLLSTYVEALPKLIHNTTNRIHTSFNQTLVTTGRLSSNKPNLQNIPIRDDRGKEIRKAFCKSSNEHIFLSADYSQIELRLMAHLSHDQHMITAFNKNEDIHTATAAKIFKIQPREVTKEMRSKAKTANFGIIYGISAFGLAQRMNITRTEAKSLIEGYFKTYPAVKEYMDQCIDTARKNGYVQTMFGRRRYLQDIHSRNSIIRGNAERNAINTPIQGTAAEIIKLAMVNIHQAFNEQNIRSKMIIQVHDELNFDVLLHEKEDVKKIVRKSMETAVVLKVPLIVEMDAGNNWEEAH
ncbi:MAG TPA: DNA polymerase I [Bacteroidales bacterium]|nr:DNA polymerase I [Bacteroidales bacterium]